MTRYRASENLPYFCTITVLDWLPVFIEARYIDPIIDSLEFSRRNKGLQVFALVVMPNHVHLIAAGPDLHSIMRDFKRFTSRTIHDQLKEHGRATILQWLQYATQRARMERGDLGLWEDGFHPKEIHAWAVFQQKADYLHANPVRKGLVAKAEDWWYSSAGFYAGYPKFCMQMDVLQF